MAKVCPLIAAATAIWFGPQATNAALTCGPLINILCDKVRAVNSARQTAAVEAIQRLSLAVCPDNSRQRTCAGKSEWEEDRGRERGRERGRSQWDSLQFEIPSSCSCIIERVALPCLASGHGHKGISNPARWLSMSARRWAATVATEWAN